MKLCRLAKGSEEKCSSRCCGRTFRKEIWFFFCVCACPSFRLDLKLTPAALIGLMPSHLSGSQFELNSMRLAKFIIAQHHASSVSLIPSLKFFTSPHLTSTTDCAQHPPEHCYKSHSWSKYPKVVAFIQMNEYLVIRKFDILAMKIVRHTPDVHRRVRRMRTCTIDWSDSSLPFSTT